MYNHILYYYRSPSVGQKRHCVSSCIVTVSPFSPSVGEGDETEETEGGDPNSGAEVSYHGYK